ncbi:MAG: pilus assembly protein PilP [Proteobacteria bacterium]|jgi:type IV pilus assembly protein PilP|nr:pilus assembly protein PilP [Pseudomonadota bacterium]
MRWTSPPCWAVGLVAVALLGGCSSDTEDIHQWMSEQRRLTQPKITPISEPKRYVPLAYSESGALDPFSSQRLTQVLRQEVGPENNSARLLAAEQNRRKEPLESYPLDVMEMVGSLDRQGQREALVRVDKLLYRVKTGNYLGQNYGLVTQISENEVKLREIVQDAAGEWIERTAALQLQEKTK